MGIRRNFVPRRGKIAPYFDVSLGVGRIDAKGPSGVLYAQGQDITFTVNMGSGVRYNLSPRYAFSGGLNFMHISNLDLSESNGKPNWGVRNYGINVYGPMVGFDATGASTPLGVIFALHRSSYNDSPMLARASSPVQAPGERAFVICRRRDWD